MSFIMHALKARVVNGRYVIDEPAHLPEGAEVELQLMDGDEFDAAEPARLHAALEEAADDIDAGRVISAEEFLRRLRALRCDESK
jgi:uridine phosphorylase